MEACAPSAEEECFDEQPAQFAEHRQEVDRDKSRPEQGPGRFNDKNRQAQQGGDQGKVGQDTDGDGKVVKPGQTPGRATARACPRTRAPRTSTKPSLQSEERPRRASSRRGLFFCVSTMPESATVKRNLRSGTPLWLRRGAPRVGHLPLERNLRVDVAIVGAGISGALIADAMLAAGQSVAVFDRRGPVKGSTPASTALLQFEIDTPLTLLTRKIGRDRAVRAWLRSATAVDALRARGSATWACAAPFTIAPPPTCPATRWTWPGCGPGGGARAGRPALRIHRARPAAGPRRHRGPRGDLVQRRRRTRSAGLDDGALAVGPGARRGDPFARRDRGRGARAHRHDITTPMRPCRARPSCRLRHRLR